MPTCIEKARAIMRVVAADLWNHKIKHERTRLWRMYCSPQVKLYTPDGSEANGYEECDLNYEKLHADGREDWKFELTGDLWMSGNVLMQTWFFGKGQTGWSGWDVVTLNDRGEVVSLYGLIEGAFTPVTSCKNDPSEAPALFAHDVSTTGMKRCRGGIAAPTNCVPVLGNSSIQRYTLC